MNLLTPHHLCGENRTVTGPSSKTGSEEVPHITPAAVEGLSSDSVKLQKKENKAYM